MKRGAPGRSLAALGLVACFLARPAAAEEAEISPENIARAKAATAMVELGEAGSGSAFLVDASGLFATDRHVAEALPRGTPLKLILNAGQADQAQVRARIIALSPGRRPRPPQNR